MAVKGESGVKVHNWMNEPVKVSVGFVHGPA